MKIVEAPGDKALQRQFHAAHIVRGFKEYQVIGWSDTLKSWEILSGDRDVAFEQAVQLVATIRAKDEELYQRWVRGDREGIAPMSFWRPYTVYRGKINYAKDSPARHAPI